ncbi:hypothetical protein CAAR111675_07140 [Campylobacter armoricus]
MIFNPSNFAGIFLKYFMFKIIDLEQYKKRTF